MHVRLQIDTEIGPRPLLTHPGSASSLLVSSLAISSSFPASSVTTVPNLANCCPTTAAIVPVRQSPATPALKRPSRHGHVRITPVVAQASTWSSKTGTMDEQLRVHMTFVGWPRRPATLHYATARRRRAMETQVYISKSFKAVSPAPGSFVMLPWFLASIPVSLLVYTCPKPVFVKASKAFLGLPFPSAHCCLYLKLNLPRGSDDRRATNSRVCGRGSRYYGRRYRGRKMNDLGFRVGGSLARMKTWAVEDGVDARWILTT